MNRAMRFSARLITLVALLLLWSAPVTAQTPFPDGWRRLERPPIVLGSGAKLVVHLAESPRRGAFLFVTDPLPQAELGAAHLNCGADDRHGGSQVEDRDIGERASRSAAEYWPAKTRKDCSSHRLAAPRPTGKTGSTWMWPAPVWAQTSKVPAT